MSSSLFLVVYSSNSNHYDISFNKKMYYLVSSLKIFKMLRASHKLKKIFSAICKVATDALRAVATEVKWIAWYDSLLLGCHYVDTVHEFRFKKLFVQRHIDCDCEQPEEPNIF